MTRVTIAMLKTDLAATTRERDLLQSQKNTLMNRLQCAIHNHKNTTRKLRDTETRLLSANRNSMELADRLNIVARQKAAILDDFAGVAFELERCKEDRDDSYEDLAMLDKAFDQARGEAQDLAAAQQGWEETTTVLRAVSHDRLVQLQTCRAALQDEKAAHAQTQSYLANLANEAEDLRNSEPGIWTLDKASFVATINRLKRADTGRFDGVDPYVYVKLDNTITRQTYAYRTNGLLLFKGDKVRVPVRSFKKTGSYSRSDNVILATVVGTSNLNTYGGELKSVIGLDASSPKRLERTLMAKVNDAETTRVEKDKYIVHLKTEVARFKGRAERYNTEADNYLGRLQTAHEKAQKDSATIEQLRSALRLDERLLVSADTQLMTQGERVSLMQAMAAKWMYNGVGSAAIKSQGRDHATVNESRIWWFINTVSEWS